MNLNVLISHALRRVRAAGAIGSFGCIVVRNSEGVVWTPEQIVSKDKRRELNGWSMEHKKGEPWGGKQS